MLDIRF